MDFAKLLLLAPLLLAPGTARAYNIPDELIHCYRGNETLPGSPFSQRVLLELIAKVERNNPTTLDMRMMSVELVHRLRYDGIERAPGVQETPSVTPFSPRGIMVPKYTVLRQLVSNIPGRIDLEQSLTPTEVCLLHRMLSSSIEPFQRGDEQWTCPLTLTSQDGNPQAPWITRNKVQTTNTNRTAFTRPISRCPLELGVSHSQQFGTLSPGTVLMSLAAGLQPQNVLISDFVSAYRKQNPYEKLETMESTDDRRRREKLFASLESIDNTYAAGLAGDLAEVALYQGPTLRANVTVGMVGSWNDTFFPRARFLPDHHGGRWEMTDSEIIAGIDGHFLAQQIQHFVNRLRRLRLSQVLEMYYSQRGIPVTSIENVLHKKGSRPGLRPNPRHSEMHDDSWKNVFNVHGINHFRSVFEDEDEGTVATEDELEEVEISGACQRRDILRSIDREKLRQETFKFVEILQYTTGSIIVQEALMRRICDAAVDRFFERAATLLDTMPACKDTESARLHPNVDLIVVIDGSRNEYENLRLLSHVAELAEVSHSGSSISVVHGTTGRFIVNSTHSVTSMFAQLRNINASFPSHLSLSRSFSSIGASLSRQMDYERGNFTVGAKAPHILVFSQAHRITQADYDSARRMLQASFEQFPDLYLTFVTNDGNTYRNLTDFTGIRHSRLPAEHYHIIEPLSVDLYTFSDLLGQRMRAIPQRLIAPFCHTEGNRDLWWNALVREEYEQYLTPGVDLRYRLSQSFLWNAADIRVQFMNAGYGEFTVCSSRDHRLENVATCQSTGPEQESVWFNYTDPCFGAAELQCSSIYFVVRLDNSNMMCNENDCHFPDQVRFVVRHQGLRCLNDGSGAGIRSGAIGWQFAALCGLLKLAVDVRFRVWR